MSVRAGRNIGEQPSGATPATPVVEVVDVVSALPVDQGLTHDVIAELTAIGSSELGFRTTGTPEDAQVADAVAARFRAAGLSDVAVEPVRVDAWRFFGAHVTTGDHTWTCSSFGGVPGTDPDGVTARFVDVGDPRRNRLDRFDAHGDLRGAVVLVDWHAKSLHPSVFALELMRHKVAAMIVTCPPGGAFYQGEHALGAFDGHWPADGPPMVMMAKEDAAALRAAAPPTVTVSLQVERTRACEGYNVVGYLPGELPGPIVVGAHHDAWFRGAFDNTSGVAVTIALADALVRSDYRQRHTICFSTRTGEEFGAFDSPYDWCVGAWEQVHTTHPQWATDSPFHLCVEASGLPGVRSIVEAPVELRSWARRTVRLAQDHGWTPTGWRIAPPVAGTEQWPYLIAGVPGIAAYAWETGFADTDYHSQRDTISAIDFDILTSQIRLYALLLLSADADIDAVFDHRARSRELAAIARRHDHPALAAAAARHHDARGADAFRTIGAGVLGLDAHTAVAYPHEQSARDLVALDAALAALRNDEPGAALRSLRRVGTQFLHDYLSRPAMGAYAARFGTRRLAGSWGGASHPTRSPAVWDEIEALRTRRSNPPDVDALIERLADHRESARAELHRRLDAMTRSLTRPGPKSSQNAPSPNAPSPKGRRT